MFFFFLDYFFYEMSSHQRWCAYVLQKFLNEAKHDGGKFIFSLFEEKKMSQFIPTSITLYIGQLA